MAKTVPTVVNSRLKRPILLGIGTIVVVIALLVGLLNWVATAKPWPQDGKLHVLAAENFWGNITAQIGGGQIDVTSIISNPNTDPHLYESDAHDAAAVASADLVVENGVGYDDFIDKLMAAAPNQRRVVVSAAKVLDVAGNDPNPHLWYDTPRVPQVAAAIAAQLEAKDPAHAADYRHNLAQFDASLQPITNIVVKIAAKYPQAPVAYTERVPGYLLANANLSVQTPPGFAGAVEDGNDPSPADTAAMDSLITSHRIKVLLYNAQVTSAVTQHVRSLAGQAGIPVVGVTETLPAGASSYQSWQLSQVQALLKALGN